VALSVSIVLKAADSAPPCCGTAQTGEQTKYVSRRVGDVVAAGAAVGDDAVRMVVQLDERLAEEAVLVGHGPAESRTVARPSRPASA
jgi:hypothetical protein